MEHRHLGTSGLKISEITYGNWLTHGSQVENDAAVACVHAALDEGISTFDTADVYANTMAETVLGTDHVDLYQAHRYDYATPLEETMQAFADLVRSGKVLYVGVSEWTADQLRAGHALSKQLGFQLISNQPQYSMLWRVIEGEVVPTSRELGISQIVWSPIAQGVLTGKYTPGGELPAGSRATDAKGGADMIKRFMSDDVLTRVQGLKPVAAELGWSMAQLAVAWVLQNDNVATAIIGASKPEQVRDNARAAGTKIPAELMARIDEVLGDVVESDPAKTFESSPKTREA